MKYRYTFIVKILIILFMVCPLLTVREASAVPPVEINVNVYGIGASTGGPLALNRVELVFDNGRGNITVPLNGIVRAKAFINYTGNGVLNGAWVVDGRVIQQVNRTLTFGTDIVIETEDVPPLPTFDPGRHTVTLQIISPAVSFSIPVMEYYVTTTPGKTGIMLYAPENGIFLHKDELVFSWNDPAETGFYQVIVWQGTRSVMNALTRDSAYRPPEAMLWNLTEGKDYTWQVTALDKSGRESGISDKRGFRIRKETGAVIFRAVKINAESAAGRIKGHIPLAERYRGSRNINISKSVSRGTPVTISALVENWLPSTARQIIVEFNVDGNLVSRQVIPALQTREWKYVPVTLYWTTLEESIDSTTGYDVYQPQQDRQGMVVIPSDKRDHTVSIKVLYQGKALDSATVSLAMGVPTVAGLDFTGSIKGGLFTGLDFRGGRQEGAGRQIRETVEGLDFIGIQASKTTSGVTPYSPMVSKGIPYDRAQTSGQQGAHTINGLDFTGKSIKQGAAPVQPMQVVSPAMSRRAGSIFRAADSSAPVTPQIEQESAGGLWVKPEITSCPESAPVGSIIRIEGKGLGDPDRPDETLVLFPLPNSLRLTDENNARLGQIISISNGRSGTFSGLEVKVPLGAVTQKIAVKTPGGDTWCDSYFTPLYIAHFSSDIFTSTGQLNYLHLYDSRITIASGENNSRFFVSPEMKALGFMDNVFTFPVYEEMVDALLFSTKVRVRIPGANRLFQDTTIHSSSVSAAIDGTSIVLDIAFESDGAEFIGEYETQDMVTRKIYWKHFMDIDIDNFTITATIPLEAVAPPSNYGRERYKVTTGDITVSTDFELRFKILEAISFDVNTSEMGEFVKSAANEVIGEYLNGPTFKEELNSFITDYVKGLFVSDTIKRIELKTADDGGMDIIGLTTIR